MIKRNKLFSLGLFLGTLCSFHAAYANSSLTCTPTSPCQFTIPAGTSVHVTLDNLQKNLNYTCDVVGIGAVGYLDQVGAKSIGIDDLAADRKDATDTLVTFSTHQMTVVNGAIDFSVVAYGDLSLNEEMVCHTK
jgi:hypothetical protein